MQLAWCTTSDRYYDSAPHKSFDEVRLLHSAATRPTFEPSPIIVGQTFSSEHRYAILLRAPIDRAGRL